MAEYQRTEASNLSRDLYELSRTMKTDIVMDKERVCNDLAVRILRTKKALNDPCFESEIHVPDNVQGIAKELSQNAGYAKKCGKYVSDLYVNHQMQNFYKKTEFVAIEITTKNTVTKKSINELKDCCEELADTHMYGLVEAYPPDGTRPYESLDRFYGLLSDSINDVSRMHSLSSQYKRDGISVSKDDVRNYPKESVKYLGRVCDSISDVKLFTVVRDDKQRIIEAKASRRRLPDFTAEAKRMAAIDDLFDMPNTDETVDSAELTKD